MSRFTIRWLASGLVWLVLVVPTFADTPPPRPPQEALDRLRDLALTLKARRTLTDDVTLGRYNFGVWVENGVASLWGGIPNETVGAQAIARLKTVPGIREVRPQLHPLGPVAPTTGHSVGYGPRTVPPPPPTVSVPSAAPVLQARPVVPVASVEVPRQPAPSLADRIRTVQRSELRFQEIPVTVQEGILMVQRGVASDEDTLEFARRLRTLPGVRDVVLTID